MDNANNALHSAPLADNAAHAATPTPDLYDVQDERFIVAVEQIAAALTKLVARIESIAAEEAQH